MLDLPLIIVVCCSIACLLQKCSKMDFMTIVVKGDRAGGGPPNIFGELRRPQHDWSPAIAMPRQAGATHG